MSYSTSEQSFISRNFTYWIFSTPTLSTSFIQKDENEQNDKVLIDEDKVKTILDYEGGAAANWNDFNCVDFTCFLWYDKVNIICHLKLATKYRTFLLKPISFKNYKLDVYRIFKAFFFREITLWLRNLDLCLAIFFREITFNLMLFQFVSVRSFIAKS